MKGGNICLCIFKDDTLYIHRAFPLHYISQCMIQAYTSSLHTLRPVCFTKGIIQSEDPSSRSDTEAHRCCAPPCATQEARAVAPKAESNLGGWPTESARVGIENMIFLQSTKKGWLINGEEVDSCEGPLWGARGLFSRGPR